MFRLYPRAASAYSAGKTLQARAIDFSYYIMSSTWVPDCLIFDIDGEQLVYEKGNSGDFNITRFTFDLDRCIFHQDLNLPGRLAKLLKERGEDVEREKWLPLEYKGVKLDFGYRLDFLVADAVVVEVKALPELLPAHQAQLLTYMKLGGWKAGLLINFHECMLKQGIKRVVHGLPE